MAGLLILGGGIWMFNNALFNGMHTHVGDILPFSTNIQQWTEDIEQSSTPVSLA
jgi:hypothetical protein